MILLFVFAVLVTKSFLVNLAQENKNTIKNIYYSFELCSYRQTDGRTKRQTDKRHSFADPSQVTHSGSSSNSSWKKRRGVIIIYSVVTKFQWISHHSTPPILLNISQILLQPNMIRGKNSHQLMFSSLGLGITLGYPQKCSTNQRTSKPNRSTVGATFCKKLGTETIQQRCDFNLKHDIIAIVVVPSVCSGWFHRPSTKYL